MRTIICAAVCNTTACPFNAAFDATVNGDDQPACSQPAEVLWKMLVAVASPAPVTAAAASAR